MSDNQNNTTSSHNSLSALLFRICGRLNIGVVEHGTITPTAPAGETWQESWKYVKWSDDTLELWGTHDETIDITTASGSIFTNENALSIAYPIAFTESLPFVQMTASANDGTYIVGQMLSSSSNSKARTPRYRFTRPTSRAGVATRMTVYARGKYQSQ